MIVMVILCGVGQMGAITDVVNQFVKKQESFKSSPVYRKNNMKTHFFLIIASAFCLYSCGRESIWGRDDFENTIDLDTAKAVDCLLLSDLCDSVSTIILEMDGNLPMATVDKIVHVGDRLYVSDRPSNINGANVIAEFDMRGKFIRRYGNRGRGPGEYVGISDFVVDEIERRLYLFDMQTQRIIAYDLDSGIFLEDMRLEQNGSRSNVIASIGNLFYMDTRFWDYDESKHMLKSWSKTNPANENDYLTWGKHLEGWTNTSLENNSRFIWRSGSDFCLFSNKFSNEIFKCTPEGVINYIYVNSESYIDAEQRYNISAALYRRPDDIPAAGRFQILREIDSFHDFGNYFETERHIGFTVISGIASYTVVFDKNNGEVILSSGFPKIDIVIKADYLDTFHLSPFQADTGGLFYGGQPEDAARIRTAAREGMLVDNLDRLEELKQLPDWSNPVLFYMKFKDPLR